MRKNWFEWQYASLEDRAACRHLIRHGSRSFHAASLLMPKDLRDPSYAIYAFCRIADDGVDLGTSQDAAISQLRERLDAIYAKRPLNHPCDRALTDVVQLYDLPRPLFDALIEGLEWDDTGQSYETIEDLHAYAARVASAVGTIMTCLMGRRSPATLARACDLGVAMQLTNIARDVGEDARAGRVYLPHSWLRQEGIDPVTLIANPVPSAELGRVVERVLGHADMLYERSAPGIAELPGLCRASINAARRLYQSIGHVVAENGYDSVSGRAVVSAPRKLGIAIKAALEASFLRKAPEAPSLDETRFLVDAVANHPSKIASVPATGIDERIGRIVMLFHSLEKRSSKKVPRNNPVNAE